MFIRRLKDLCLQARDFIRLSEMQMEAYPIHSKVFPKYKDCYRGKSVVVFGGGPSLDKYKPIDGAIQIGVNGTFLSDRVELDYLFYQDYLSAERQKAMNNYRDGKCKKFYGIHYMDLKAVISIPDAEKAKAERYFFYDLPTQPFPFDFTLDISAKPFITYSSTIFVPLQFALYTHPKKIYIVGCDCSQDGHSSCYNTFALNPALKKFDDMDNIVNGWRKFKAFQEAFYPDIEIISINPVGLKGLFKDVYQ